MVGKVRKCLTQDGQAVIVAVDATELVAESMSRLEAWPPSMYHLGQALMSAALLQALPDRHDDERLELQWKVNEGPFGSLFAECRDRKQLRGTVLHPQAPVTELQVPMGPGLFQVRRLDPSLEGPLATGIVQSSGDVVQDVLSYLEKSEQKICSMALWIDIAWNDAAAQGKPFVVRHAYGFLVNVLPQKTLEQTHAILYQWDRHIHDLGPISKWVIRGDPTADILSFVSAEFKPNITYERDLEFFCTCNQERAERALAFMDKEDSKMGAGVLPASGERQEVRCEFCGRVYLLTSQGLA